MKRGIFTIAALLALAACTGSVALGTAASGTATNDPVQCSSLQFTCGGAEQLWSCTLDAPSSPSFGCSTSDMKTASCTCRGPQLDGGQLTFSTAPAFWNQAQMIELWKQCGDTCTETQTTDRSACSTGTAYPDGTAFPQLPAQPANLPACIARCGAEAHAASPRLDELPSGTCSVEGEACATSVWYYADALAGSPCRVDGMACTCHDGNWSCGITTPGDGLCSYAEVACTSLQDNCTGAETSQACTLSGGANLPSLECHTYDSFQTVACACSAAGVVGETFAPPTPAPFDFAPMVERWKERCGGACRP